MTYHTALQIILEVSLLALLLVVWRLCWQIRILVKALFSHPGLCWTKNTTVDADFDAEFFGERNDP